MSFGQGRFLKNRIKRRILQERADNTSKPSLDEQVLLDQDVRRLFYQDKTQNIKNLLKSIDNDISTGLNGKDKENTGKNLSVTKVKPINKLVAEHCKEYWTKDEFSTNLIEFQAERNGTGLSETGSRQLTMKRYSSYLLSLKRIWDL